MPHVYNPPLPPVPDDVSEEGLIRFMLDHTADEVVAFFGGLLADDELDGDWIIVDDLLDGIEQFPINHPDKAMEIVELMLVHENPTVRAQINRMFRSLLGRGIDRIEEIAWDELLFDLDDFVFRVTYSELKTIVSDELKPRTFLWTTDCYDWVYSLGNRTAERLSHYMKLAHHKARFTAVEAQRDAKPKEAIGTAPTALF